MPLMQIDDRRKHATFPPPLHSNTRGGTGTTSSGTNTSSRMSLRSQSRILLRSSRTKPATMPGAIGARGGAGAGGRVSPTDTPNSLASHRSTQSIEYWKSYAQKIHTRLQQRKKRRRSSVCSTGSTLSNPGVSIQDMRPDEYLVTRVRSVSHQVPLPLPVPLSMASSRSGTDTDTSRPSNKIMRRNSQSVARGTLSSATAGALLERHHHHRHHATPQQSVGIMPRGALSAALDGHRS